MFVYYTEYIGAQIMTYKMQRLTGGMLEEVEGWSSLTCDKNSLPCEENCRPVHPLVVVVAVINLRDVELIP